MAILERYTLSKSKEFQNLAKNPGIVPLAPIINPVTVILSSWMFKSIYEVSDVVSAFLFCPDDNSYLLTPSDDGTNELTIQSIKARTDGWWFTARRLVKEKFNHEFDDKESLLKVYRFWNPVNPMFLNHAVFQVPLSQDKKKNIRPSSKIKGKLRWLSESEIIRLTNEGSMRSPEILDFVSAISGKDVRPRINKQDSWPVVINYRPLEMLTEVLENHFTVTTEAKGSSSLTPQEQLVQAAGFKKNVQTIILQLFLFSCYPFMYMSKKIFTDMMVKIGWPQEQTSDLFRAADVFGQNALSFRDFLIFMAAVEPSTLHSGPPAEVRCLYMFRFLDANNDGNLEYSELRTLVLLLRSSKDMPVDQATLIKETDIMARTIGLDPGTKLSLNGFVKAVGELKIRGTSTILRSAKNLLAYIKEKTDTKPLLVTEYSKSPPPAAPGGEPDTKSSAPPKEVVPLSAKLQFSRLLSVDSFHSKSLPNELLTGLHYFCTPVAAGDAAKKGARSKDAFTWGQIDPVAFGKVLLQICAKATEICRRESRLLEIQSPVFVLGDLHGNLPDLMCFEKVLWSLGPNLTPSTFLFLGDYVDRGPHGVEVVAYLLAYKVQNPTKLKLLRGNHEIRDIQEMFTFQKECMTKFGNVMGKEVWERVNDVFDSLPVAATIDGRLFCCHGGIPPPWLCPVVSVINSVPCPLNNPCQQSDLAWNLMWNDPI
ncbi:hypothetical protein L9F63_021593, partial [Diploptera punctata]